MIEFILYINLLNLSWIKNVYFLGNIEPLNANTGRQNNKKIESLKQFIKFNGAHDVNKTHRFKLIGL